MQYRRERNITSHTYDDELLKKFSESDLPIKVDVLDWSRISEEFKKNIQEKYIVLKTKH